MQNIRMWQLLVCCLLITLAFATAQAEFAYVLGANTFVPLEMLIEGSGTNGATDATKKTIPLNAYEKGKFLFTLGSDTATRDGKPLKLEAALFQLDGATYVPLGALNKIFNFTTATPPQTGFLALTYGVPENVTENGVVNHTVKLVLRTLTPEELAMRTKPIAAADARAMFNAIAHGDVKAVAQQMKDHPERRFAHDNYGNLPLDSAILNRQSDMVETLLANGASLDDVNVDGDTALHVCANAGHGNSHANMRYANPGIGKVDQLSQYPEGSSEEGMLAFLLKQKGNINAMNVVGMRPLHCACYASADHPDLAKLLLDAGADVNAEDCSGWTALFFVSNADVAAQLLAKGADLKHCDRDGQNVLLVSAGDDSDNVAMMSFLLEHGIPADVKSLSGETPLMRAASQGHVKVMTLLLQKGADVNAADNDKLTALMQMVSSGAGNDNAVATVKFLLAHGARVNAEHDGENAPLHAACQGGNLQMVKLLLAAGAKVNAKNADGQTPLQLAKEGKYAEIIKALVAAGAK